MSLLQCHFRHKIFQYFSFALNRVTKPSKTNLIVKLKSKKKKKEKVNYFEKLHALLLKKMIDKKQFLLKLPTYLWMPYICIYIYICTYWKFEIILFAFFFFHIISGTKKMEYKTRQWHENCFCCCVCKIAIGTKSFIPREQEIYCASCYEEKFATRCIKCNKVSKERTHTHLRLRRSSLIYCLSRRLWLHI